MPIYRPSPRPSPASTCGSAIGLSAPAGTPAAVVKRLDEANRQALQSPEIQKALAAQGFATLIQTAEQFDAYYRSERDKWAKVIKASGMDKE